MGKYRTYVMPFGLTRREREMAQWLIYYHGRVVPYPTLYNVFFGVNETDPAGKDINYLRILVNSIRRKWSNQVDHLDIETIRGTGYTLVYR